MIFLRDKGIEIHYTLKCNVLMFSIYTVMLWFYNLWRFSLGCAK